MKAKVRFSPEATVEQRKMAINQTLERYMPFRVKHIAVKISDQKPMEYTGGFSQMTLAKSITIQFDRS